ncbi:hypothetical protein ERO13_D04G186801v2 [Gossypium hirsutum]|uniref:Uncharacterized protein n=1 Tax=Gossypium darwinii TaxID=34276 RepID=A0A5D2D1Q0_GOSDA|nr:hypothetical protein ERO13_D04G186801v2 [Gossypium hirsutum]TYG74998.1 hypothetical protein ES288_D04G229000v1 [Gossypium darwinii]
MNNFSSGLLPHAISKTLQNYRHRICMKQPRNPLKPSILAPYVPFSYNETRSCFFRFNFTIPKSEILGLRFSSM